MSISLLTLVKNRADHLAQLIEGLRRSDQMPDELIIVDMGSTPPVQPIDLPFPMHIKRMDGSGLPLAAARNLAAASAGSDRLLFLDVDCIPMRGLIRAMDRALSSHKGLICAEALYLNPQDARGQWQENDLLRRSKGHPARRFPEQGLQKIENPGLFWSLIFGIRQKDFIKLSGFDAGFTGYGAEDTDFGYRAKKAGLPLLFMGGPGAFHQHHAIYDPPLQHFADIINNARKFQLKWGEFPMQGWLAAFEAIGLIRQTGEKITILRYPTSSEIQAAYIMS